jgi:hypothetical protein
MGAQDRPIPPLPEDALLLDYERFNQFILRGENPIETRFGTPDRSTTASTPIAQNAFSVKQAAPVIVWRRSLLLNGRSWPVSGTNVAEAFRLRGEAVRKE